MKLFAILLVLAGLIVTSCKGDAFGDLCRAGDVVAQPEISTELGTGLTPTANRGESFVAICTGLISGVGIQIQSVLEEGDVSLELFEGSSWEGEPIATASYFVHHSLEGRVILFGFPASAVTKDADYAFRLFTETAQVGLGYSSGDPYPEGNLLLTTTSASEVRRVHSSDLTFQIIFEPADGSAADTFPAQIGNAMRFTGFNRQSFSFSAVDLGSYSLISYPNLAINFQAKHMTYDLIASRLYISKLGFVYNDIELVLYAGGSGYSDTPFLTLNGDEVVPSAGAIRYSDAAVTFTRLSAAANAHDVYGMPWVGDDGLYNVQITFPNLMSLNILCVEYGRDAASGAWRMHPRRWLDFEINALEGLHVVDIHGIIGQTMWNSDIPEGSWSAYRLDGITHTNFEYSQYN